MIRTFDLLNSEGQAYTLTISHRYTGFLTTAEGLGFENSPEYVRIGNSYERLTDNLNQGVISGIVQFFNPYAYQKFSAFAEFCQDKNLTLFYRTPTGLFKKDGAVTKIEKSEGDDSLKVKIEFTATSLWYEEILKTVEGSTIHILSDSSIESPCDVAVTGFDVVSANLSWKWKTESELGYKYGRLFSIDLGSSYTLHIRSDTNPYQIYKQLSDAKINLYQSSDFARPRFIFLGKGDNEITFENVTVGTFTVSARIYYETI